MSIVYWYVRASEIGVEIRKIELSWQVDMKKKNQKLVPFDRFIACTKHDTTWVEQVVS